METQLQVLNHTLNKTSTHVYSHQESHKTHLCLKTQSVNFATTLDHQAQQAQHCNQERVSWRS